jgi:uncharacterized protein (DUF1778 family)
LSLCLFYRKRTVDCRTSCTVQCRTIQVRSFQIMAHDAQRTSRVEARIAPDSLEIIRRAAEIQGRSISDFIVAAAQEAAQRTIAEIEVLRLSRQAQEQFANLLLNPPAPTPALARALERHRELIKG